MFSRKIHPGGAWERMAEGSLEPEHTDFESYGRASHVMIDLECYGRGTCLDPDAVVVSLVILIVVD